MIYRLAENYIIHYGAQALAYFFGRVIEYFTDKSQPRASGKIQMIEESPLGSRRLSIPAVEDEVNNTHIFEKEEIIVPATDFPKKIDDDSEANLYLCLVKTYLSLVKAYLSHEEYTEVLEMYKLVFSKFSDFSECIQERVALSFEETYSLLIERKKYTECEEICRSLLGFLEHNDSLRSGLIICLGDLLLVQDRVMEAEKVYMMLDAKNLNKYAVKSLLRNLLSLIELFLKQKEYTEPKKICEWVLNFPIIYNGLKFLFCVDLAREYGSQKKYEEAQQVYEIAVEIEIPDWEWELGMDQVYLHQKLCIMRYLQAQATANGEVEVQL